MKIALWFLFFVVISGCASRAPQTDELLSSTPDSGRSSSSSHRLSGVKFIDQGESFCGPSTLAMAMNWNGRTISSQELESQVYITKLRGSLPEDILTASRRHGFVAIPVRSMRQIVQEIASNNPVIVFQNVALSWLPQWHYGLVVGYDLSKTEILLHTGHSPFMKMDMGEFERTWKLADYWGLVILPAGALSATGSELEHIVATIGLESYDNEREAEKSYRKILSRWPENLVAMIGLSNFAYRKGKRSEAVYWLQKAVKIHPHSSIAKKNLAFVEKN